MSLINQVLRDLEQRQAGLDSSAGFLHGLHASPASVAGNPRRWLAFAVIFLLLALGVSVLAWAYQGFAPTRNDTLSLADAPVTAVDHAVQPTKVAGEQSVATVTTSAVRDPAPVVAAKPVRPQKMAVAQDKKDRVTPPATKKVAMVSVAPAAPELDADKSNPSVGPRASATPASPANTAADSVVKSHTNVVKTRVNRRKLNTSVSQGAEDVASQAQTELASFSQQGQIDKRQRPLTSKQQAGVAFRDAHRLLLQRHYTEAEAALKRVMRLDPLHVKAREMLVGSYLRRGDLAAAADVARQGVARLPKHAVFTKLYARILAEQNAIPSAIEVLTRHAPPLGDDLEYHAMLAALYQRQGQHQQAAKTYTELLKLRRNAGIWWIGLGVSLEASGKTNEARVAFAQARDSGSLNGRLTQYATTRLAALGGSPAQED